MIYWYDDSGAILQACAGDEAESEWDSTAGIARLQTPAQVDINTHYVAAGRLVAKPPQPSRHHTFNYSTKTWDLDIDAAWAAVRARRDDRLTASDWVILRAADQGAPVPPEWLAYRQALRDVTEQDDPLSIVWPEPPNS